MLRKRQRSRCEGFPFELPCEAEEDKQPPSGTSGLQARRGAAHFALLRRNVGADSSIAAPAVGSAASDFRFVSRIRVKKQFQGAKCRARTPSSNCESPVLAFSHSAVRRVLRLMQHSCGSARHRTSAVQHSWPAHVRHRSSKVSLRLAQTCLLFLQALCHFCSVRGPRGSRPCRLRRCGPCSAKTPQSLPGSQDTAVPAVGAACSHRRGVFHRHPVRTPCAGFTVFPGLTAIIALPSFHRPPASTS